MLQDNFCRKRDLYKRISRCRVSEEVMPCPFHVFGIFFIYYEYAPATKTWIHLLCTSQGFLICFNGVLLDDFAKSLGPAAQAGVIVERQQENDESSASKALFTLKMALFGVAMMASIVYKCT